MEMVRKILPLIVVSLALAACVAPAAEPAARRGTLALTGGGFATGELLDSAGGKTLRWQSPAFASPLEFSLAAVNTIHYPAPAQPTKPDGEVCFELSGGDVIYGSLAGLNESTFEIDAKPFGRLHVDRARIERIYRWRDRADLVYLGPNGLADWNEASRAGWREEAGQLLTDTADAALWGDLHVPELAEIELALSWKARPDFVLALGVGDDEKTLRHAFRIEVWGPDLVVLRENAREADVAGIHKIGDGQDRVHVRVYLDQKQGRCFVYSHEGQRIAQISIAPPEPGVHGGLRLTNRRGDVRMERLRIGRWNGDPPRDVEPGKSRVQLVDGGVRYGEIVGYDASKREFTLRDAAGDAPLPADRLAAVFMKTAPMASQIALRTLYQDGTQISGSLSSIAGGTIDIASPGIREPLRMPLAALKSLVVLRYEGLPQPESKSRKGTLEIEGLRLPGQLVAGESRDQASCLVWQPDYSQASAAILRGVGGRIVYREPTQPRQAAKPVAAPGQAVAGGFVGGVVQVFGGGRVVRNTIQNQNAQRVMPTVRKSLHLRTGDAIPCEVSRIDEQGVYFKTSLSEAGFVKHDMIKAIELAPEQVTTVRLNKAKRDRLLTLPRMQKDNPPTHLVRSTNGDFLRGRVVELNGEKLQIEVRLETKELPRDKIARIIWLHADELDVDAEGPADKAASTRVQALRSDGVRMTFDAERVADETVSGASPVLGACHVKVGDVDQFVFGPSIEQFAARLAYQQWKLQNAVEPKVMTEDDGEGGQTAGTESSLVGKPAPEISLQMMKSGKFQLSERKGKIVVLDFFATWCGPCLQSMPQIDQVARDFADQGVEVVAINLEEAPEAIASMFERHKLELPVALDRDGVAAARYGVTSIPQTLIIDREGNVARHYIGGGTKLGENVAASLRELLNGPAEAKTP